MRPLTSLGIGLSFVSGCLFLALVAELYYYFWWKKKRINRDIEGQSSSSSSNSSSKEFLHLFCWKKPSSLTSTALQPREIATSVDTASQDFLFNPFGGEESLDAELMRLHSLAGPPRLLFTIKEETKEDLESEDSWSTGRRSKKGSEGKSLSDLFLSSSDTPYLTPLSSPPFFTPPMAPLDFCKKSGFNPLFESSKEEDFVRMWSSPPPKFKFLKDAEEKLYRKKLMEEASEVHTNGEGDGSFIPSVIGKNKCREQQLHHSSTSQLCFNPIKEQGVKPMGHQLHLSSAGPNKELTHSYVSPNEEAKPRA